MYWEKSVLVIASLTFLLLIACSEESDQITTPQNNVNNNEIIGTWILTEIQYPSGGNTITVLPGNIGISMTIKFFDNKTGQLIQFENGSTDIDVFIWNNLGSDVEIIYENGHGEMLRCELIESNLHIEYGFETNEGNTVLASYVFEKEV
jgi:hypothetical protein